MRELNFSYAMELSFSQPVTKHQFTLRMLPMLDERQKVLECEVKIVPECVLCKGEDAFGNEYVYGEIEHAHESFMVNVHGKVSVEGNLYSLQKSQTEVSKYRYPSKYTRAGEQIRKYYQEVVEKEEDPLVFAEKLLHQLYQDMEYKPGTTNINTVAEEAMTMRQGVCQDYAQIMISICRLAGIPARYVVGMMQGEGFSHAWVEICVDEKWYGMDPTNDRVVDDSYIKLSHGRDYQDCIVNRGVFCGMGMQTQTIKVIVEDAG